MKLDTEKDVRDFLRLCLDPGHGIKRTPAKLAGIMPGPLEEALMRFAPHLGALQAEADRQEAEARKARTAYTEALAAWITGEPADVPGLCPQNRRGDKAVQEAHFYNPDDAGVQRCVFCSTPAHWGGEPADAYRTPDGRVWTLAAEVHGVPLYEAPFVGTRFTALALETLHGEITPVANGKVPEYVYNSRSVNRTTKHIPDGRGRTICPGNFQASKPMPEEEAARLTLCGGCRRRSWRPSRTPGPAARAPRSTTTRPASAPTRDPNDWGAPEGYSGAPAPQQIRSHP